MGRMPSFESLGVHPTLVAALRRIGMQPTAFQARVLANTTGDFADVIVDGRAAGVGSQGAGGSGGTAEGNTSLRALTTERHTLITIFTAHCLLSAKDPSRCTAVVVASTKDCAAQLQKSMKTFAPQCHISFHTLTNEGQEPPPPVGLDGDDSESLSSPPAGKNGRIFITTLRVLRTWNKEFFRYVTTFAVEDAGRNNDRHLEEVLRLLTPPPVALPTGASSPGPPLNNFSTSRPTVNIFLMYLMPLTKVSPAIRYRLNRRNRRYYHLQAPPAAVGAALQTPSGTAPTQSTQVAYMLYLDERDREELLYRVLQMYQSRRIVLLTHHKEVKHLYQTVCKWDLYNVSSDASGRGADYICCMLRSDTVERHETSLTGFLRESSSSNFPSGGGNSDNSTISRGGSSLLVVWDAFTAVDLMDVDVFIQYYPPQKSLTERERAEYIQVLHTTADPENSHRGRRTMLITFLAISDFTLASFFMRQYGQSGPILNMTPHHPEFERCLGDPKGVLKLKQKKERNRRDGDRDEVVHYPNVSSGSSGGGPSAPVPLPRSMRHTSPGYRREKEHLQSGGNRGGAAEERMHWTGKRAEGRSRRAAGDDYSRTNSTTPSSPPVADSRGAIEGIHLIRS